MKSIQNSKLPNELLNSSKELTQSCLNLSQKKKILQSSILTEKNQLAIFIQTPQFYSEISQNA